MLSPELQGEALLKGFIEDDHMNDVRKRVFRHFVSVVTTLLQMHRLQIHSLGIFSRET